MELAVYTPPNHRLIYLESPMRKEELQNWLLLIVRVSSSSSPENLNALKGLASRVKSLPQEIPDAVAKLRDKLLQMLNASQFEYNCEIFPLAINAIEETFPTPQSYSPPLPIESPIRSSPSLRKGNNTR